MSPCCCGSSEQSHWAVRCAYKVWHVDTDLRIVAGDESLLEPAVHGDGDEDELSFVLHVGEGGHEQVEPRSLFSVSVCM